MVCTVPLYTFTPYRRFVCGSRTRTSSSSPVSLCSLIMASSLQSVMYIQSNYKVMYIYYGIPCCVHSHTLHFSEIMRNYTHATDRSLMKGRDRGSGFLFSTFHCILLQLAQNTCTSKGFLLVIIINIHVNRMANHWKREYKEVYQRGMCNNWKEMWHYLFFQLLNFHTYSQN